MKPVEVIVAKETEDKVQDEGTPAEGQVEQQQETAPEGSGEADAQATIAPEAVPVEATEVHPDGAVEHVAGEGEGEAEETADKAGPQIDLAVMEALLFSTHHPMTAGRLAELLELDSTKPIRAAIKDLNRAYADTGRSFRVEQVAGGYQLLTLPEYGDVLNRMHQREADTKLTKSALETLAIVAYKQPILRADVEAIRGVACGETIRSLMEKHLVKIAGRAELPGRPILYGTTKRFLELFGLNSLKDLPQQEEGLPKPKPQPKQEQPAAAPATDEAAAQEQSNPPAEG